MTVSAHEEQWWKEAVVYQIYPASFCDSNGDGIGDLPGITSKLDYIASLGADVIWICPMYDSPQVDMGYDISNYENVYGPYGTLEDMLVLIRETHARGMRIMLDLVINHTSDQHAWFKESRSSKDNRKRDWYIWRSAKYTPTGERLPPNNWRSNFGGGSVWEWDEATQEYYLHLFAKEQPDLNWENPETRKAIYASAIEFWLERGVDGFRVDTVNMYSKPPGMPDAPVVDPSTPYQPAGLVYCNGPRIHEYLGEINAILARYGAITVGELPCTPDTSRVLRYVSAKARQLNMVFQFDIVDLGFGTAHKFDTVPKAFTLPDFKAAVGRTQALMRGSDGWSTVFLENHDQARSVSRFGDDRPEFRARSARLLALMQACLSGTLYLYQGQELGLVNAPPDGRYPPENYVDIDSSQYYALVRERHRRAGEQERRAALHRAFAAMQHIARDHARIPMPWDSRARHAAGFSEAAERAGAAVREPWMKPHPLALAAENGLDVASQAGDPDSVLAFWRRMLQFRRGRGGKADGDDAQKGYKRLLVYGNFRDLRPEDRDLFVFVKEPHDGEGLDRDGERLLVVLNFTAEEKSWEVPGDEELGGPPGEHGGARELLLIMSTYPGKVEKGKLEPFEGQVYLVR